MSHLQHLTKAERRELLLRARRSLEAISDAEDARITAEAESDPDNPPMTDDEFMRARRGRPPAALVKRAINVRLDQDIIETLKQGGPRWQTRMNELLRKALKLDDAA
ncbi:BrnA antitoxin family protein [Aureimonas altamirensis]|uniref:BrnA antitoxin family protein n=1 Tax=Aureimonas altamirensis TaxID=370622 RepID=UPI002037315C|nr:BrnA antitoxin family protein [Aureimonas altamirensis]MCM2503024.1 BrnA antitoxin family protein [Aureimonas altamirensis]